MRWVALPTFARCIAGKFPARGELAACLLGLHVAPDLTHPELLQLSVGRSGGALLGSVELVPHAHVFAERLAPRVPAAHAESVP
jgi:hypothetical protein